MEHQKFPTLNSGFNIGTINHFTTKGSCSWDPPLNQLKYLFMPACSCKLTHMNCLIVVALMSISEVPKKENCTKQWSVCVLLVLLDVLSESLKIMRPVALVNICLNYSGPFLKLRSWLSECSEISSCNSIA